MTNPADWKPQSLSTVQRCRGCGWKLPEPLPEICPHCHNSLVDVGVSNEFVEWAEQRKQGRAKFLLKTVTWLVLTIYPAMLIVVYLIRGEIDWLRITANYLTCIAIVIICTLISWNASERAYVEWKKRQAVSEPQHEEIQSS